LLQGLDDAVAERVKSVSPTFDRFLLLALVT
jgi:hypothetical protein